MKIVTPCSLVSCLPHQQGRSTVRRYIAARVRGVASYNTDFHTHLCIRLAEHELLMTTNVNFRIADFVAWEGTSKMCCI